MVLWAVCGMPVVKPDVEAIEVLLAPRCNLGNELLRRFARFFSRDHDGRAMRIVRTHKVHRVPLHPLKTHPDVGLDVLHHVAHMERRVGVGQSSGDEDLAWHG